MCSYREPWGALLIISDLYPAPSEFLWREFYRAALFETDPYQLQEHIARAEWAIVLRGRQLLGLEEEQSRQEEQELDEAFGALQALKNYIFTRPNFTPPNASSISDAA